MKTINSFMHLSVAVILCLSFVACNSMGQDNAGMETTQAGANESQSSDRAEQDSHDETEGLEPSSFIESESNPETGSSSEGIATENHMPERDIDYVELTNLSNSMELNTYRAGDTYQALTITDVSVSQQEVDGQWENVKVTVKFMGELRLRGTLYYAGEGLTSFVISEESYEIAPGILVDLPDYNGIHPTSVYLDNDLIRDMLTNTEGNFEKEAEITFSEYDLVYGRYSSMSAIGNPVKIILDE